MFQRAWTSFRMHWTGSRTTMAISGVSADRGASLTPRQKEVLRLQAYGMSYEEISNHLGLSVWTVKNHHKQAVRSLQISLTVYPSDRVRTTLACYIMGLLDGGVQPLDIVKRLRDATDQHPAIAEAAAVGLRDGAGEESIRVRAAD
ncbi:MAG: helix-turn-helix transcriptional regulator [Chloroflexia bacterium]|nr:helix-turn-helix transcriptional regulator [Chloroflexia bacterium]